MTQAYSGYACVTFLNNHHSYIYSYHCGATGEFCGKLFCHLLKPLNHKYVFFSYFSGYSENFYKKDDEILVFHSHELPTMPATPYPCKLVSPTPLEKKMKFLS